ncbi:hypothetical protein HPB51_006922 [Rhipicephalus microplus]|uniref:BRCT domain-containing protein n=1 Tax=Rhipicephalus microplus TaxID=6941 RepID=A0A9J6EZ52_RHIMP|nr:hypothetical protein HPB51_006922 [Rhipicephalus microplus]
MSPPDGSEHKPLLFEDVKFCLADDLQDDEEFQRLLVKHGGTLINYLSDNVTYVIADNPDSSTITEAQDLYEKPVATSSWVRLSLKCGRLLPLEAFSPHKNQIFSNTVVCPSQASLLLLFCWPLHIYACSSSMSVLDKTCTHLVATKAEGVKYQKAMAAGGPQLKIVTPDWIADSVKNKAPCDETRYHPRLRVKPPKYGNCQLLPSEKRRRVGLRDLTSAFKEDLASQSRLDELKNRLDGLVQDEIECDDGQVAGQQQPQQPQQQAPPQASPSAGQPQPQQMLAGAQGMAPTQPSPQAIMKPPPQYPYAAERPLVRPPYPPQQQPQQSPGPLPQQQATGQQQMQWANFQQQQQRKTPDGGVPASLSQPQQAVQWRPTAVPAGGDELKSKVPQSLTGQPPVRPEGGLHPQQQAALWQQQQQMQLHKVESVTAWLERNQRVRCRVVERLLIAVDHLAANLPLRASRYSAVEMVNILWVAVTATCARNCFGEANFVDVGPDAEPEASKQDHCGGDLWQRVVDSDFGERVGHLLRWLNYGR